MKKIILIILFCGIVVLCLTGCETKTNVSVEELNNINNKIIDYFQKNGIFHLSSAVFQVQI